MKSSPFLSSLFLSSLFLSSLFLFLFLFLLFSLPQTNASFREGPNSNEQALFDESGREAEPLNEEEEEEEEEGEEEEGEEGGDLGCAVEGRCECRGNISAMGSGVCWMCASL
jgi:hypothetical protein